MSQKTYKELLVNLIEKERTEHPDALEIHTPQRCQNEHGATLITFYEYGYIVTEYFLPDDDDICECPKHEIGEGYKASGKSFVVKEN